MKRRKFITVVGGAAAFFFIAVSACLAVEATITDGDTLTLSGTPYRLDGIEAPETDQVCLDEKGAVWTCGIEARDQLKKFVGKRDVRCDGNKSERNDWEARSILFPDNPTMPPGCSIKGKLAARAHITAHRGIYHLEGCRSYARTKTPDRWFCSEDEAQAEGFRKAFTCR